MAKRTIVTTPNPILTTKTQQVEKIDKEIIDLANDLQDTLNSAQKPEGAGLAANQIGSNKRVCIVRNFLFEPGTSSRYLTEDFILINPKITYRSQELESDWEGCLSVKNRYGMVPRNKKIKVTALTLDGNTVQITAKDLFARVIQHEVDHLDGVLFTARVKGKTITEKELDEIYEQD